MPSVWRVEHRETGVGPFQSYLNYHHDSVASYEERSTRLPCPWAERPDFVDRWEKIPHLHRFFYRFGCRSLHQLLDWFPNQIGREAMSYAGFVIHIYETDDLIEGLHQVAYDMRTATLLGEQPLC